MDAIVAVYSDWGIGDGVTQPVVLKADRAHFRELTAGKAVIVGRKTLEDFPGGKPLKGRNNIVITRQDLEIEGAEVVHTTEEAVECASKYPECLILGGASVFEQFFPFTDRVFVTRINADPGSSRFYPNLDEDENWVCTAESPEMSENDITYKFCTYERIDNNA